MNDDPDTFVIDSLDSIPECGKWIRRKFAVYKYWTITARAGRKRKAIQNAKMWPTLEDIATQVTWYGKKYDAEGWKDILSGSFRKAEFVPNTEGTGFVAIGMHTSEMSSTQFYDMMTFIIAFGDSQSVKWSEKAKKTQGEVLPPKEDDDE